MKPSAAMASTTSDGLDDEAERDDQPCQGATTMIPPSAGIDVTTFNVEYCLLNHGSKKVKQYILSN
jgi:hypothetical protein